MQCTSAVTLFSIRESIHINCQLCIKLLLCTSFIACDHLIPNASPKINGFDYYRKRNVVDTSLVEDQNDSEVEDDLFADEEENDIVGVGLLKDVENLTTEDTPSPKHAPLSSTIITTTTATTATTTSSDSDLFFEEDDDQVSVSVAAEKLTAKRSRTRGMTSKFKSSNSVQAPVEPTTDLGMSPFEEKAIDETASQSVKLEKIGEDGEDSDDGKEIDLPIPGGEEDTAETDVNANCIDVPEKKKGLLDRIFKKSKSSMTTDLGELLMREGNSQVYCAAVAKVFMNCRLQDDIMVL